MEKGTPYNQQHPDKADLAKLAEREAQEGSGKLDFEDSVEARAFLEKAAEAAAPGVLAQFDKTLQDLNKNRGADYGHPYHNFQVMAAFTEVLEACPDPRLRQALIMIAAKISRLVQNPYHLDSWIDIAGYARTAVMVMDYNETMDGGNTV